MIRYKADLQLYRNVKKNDATTWVSYHHTNSPSYFSWKSLLLMQYQPKESRIQTAVNLVFGKCRLAVFVVFICRLILLQWNILNQLCLARKGCVEPIVYAKSQAFFCLQNTWLVIWEGPERFSGDNIKSRCCEWQRIVINVGVFLLSVTAGQINTIFDVKTPQAICQMIVICHWTRVWDADVDCLQQAHLRTGVENKPCFGRDWFQMNGRSAKIFKTFNVHLIRFSSLSEPLDAN